VGDDGDLGFAHRLADLAWEVAMRHVASGDRTAAEKEDGSPVTPADLRVEGELRALVARERPADAFDGEEYAGRDGGPLRWVVDPVDGTGSLLAGEPEWSTLIALARGRDVRLGVVSAPALGRRWWASHGGGAWTAAFTGPPGGRGTPVPLRVSSADRLGRARVGIWPPPQRIGARERASAAGLAAGAEETVPDLDWTGRGTAEPPPPKPSTGSGTCHGGLLVAAGLLDAFLLVGAGPWDIAALVPIVREAGGAFSDLAGQDRFDTGSALFSNGRVHGEALDAVRPAP
jgi:histidinol-phosphatase